MKKHQLLLLCLIVPALACVQQKSNFPQQSGGQEAASWFSKGDWKQGWNPIPDESIDQQEFEKQYKLNPGRWEKAFSFLAGKDLTTLAPGKYELEGSDLFATVSEYPTKNEEEVQFEAHRQYADIQYIVSGQEKIGVVPFDKKQITVPYDSSKDIAFLSFAESNYRTATPERFFVFFPDDAHRPGVKVNENSQVRKVVVKVKIN